MADTLESTLFIYFTTSEKGILNAFAGTGQTRRRSSVLTGVLAEHLYDKLAINYQWTKHGTEVPKKEVVDFIANVLWSVPDDVAKLSGTRTTGAEGARKAITHGLFLALDMEYTRVYTNRNYLDPESPNYRHRAKA